jgi:hypothetical protein
MARQFPKSFRLGGLAVAAMLFGTGVLADSDDCAVPMADWQPREAVSQMAAQHGWVVRRIKIHDGCYKIYAQDANGRPLEVKVNPSTLEILQIEIEDGPDHDDSEGHDLGAAPEKN